MKKDLNQIQDFFFESLEKQLEITNVFPDNLPKIINTIIYSNRMKINDFYLENDKIDEFLVNLQAKTANTAEPIQEINKDSIFIIKNSFFHIEEVEYFLELNKNNENLNILCDSLRKIDGSQEYIYKNHKNFDFKNIDHGDVLTIFGEIKFKNDYAPECITYDFKADVAWDYFSCAECKIKCNCLILYIYTYIYIYLYIIGICEHCKNYCHRNHTTTLFLSKHKPDWPCCYCFSKGFCKAVNKNSIIKK